MSNIAGAIASEAFEAISSSISLGFLNRLYCCHCFFEYLTGCVLDPAEDSSSCCEGAWSDVRDYLTRRFLRN